MLSQELLAEARLMQQLLADGLLTQQMNAADEGCGSVANHVWLPVCGPSPRSRLNQ